MFPNNVGLRPTRYCRHSIGISSNGEISTDAGARITMTLGDLIRRHDFGPVTRSYRERFADDLTTEVMECIHRILNDPAAMRLGGTAESPWSDATWLMWL